MMEEFLEPEDDGTESKRTLMVVPVRAKSSAELEEREREYYARCQTLAGKLPIPFRMKNGEWEAEPPGEFALAVLAELGVSETEYMELMS
jgi:hypothetical protein